MKFEEAKQNSPRISARFWDEFSGKQRLLSNFFTKKGSGGALTSSSVSPSASSQTTVPLGESSQTSASDISSSLAKQPEECLTIETRCSPQNGLNAAKTLSSAYLEPQSSSKKSKRVDDVPKAGPKKKKQKVRQSTLSSFFAKPQPVASSYSPSTSHPHPPPTAVDVDGEDGEETRLSEEWAQMEADYELAISLSESSDSVATRAPSGSQSKVAWTYLLAPLQPPKCKVHGEPCKIFTVNKPGLNKGKAFFICSR